MFPKVAAIIEYMTINPSEAKETLQHYRKGQHPDARKAAREKYVKVLQGRISDPDELQDMVDQLEGEYCWPDYEQDDFSASICRMHATTTATPALNEAIQAPPPAYLGKELQQASQPIRYPDMSQDSIKR